MLFELGDVVPAARGVRLHGVQPLSEKTALKDFGFIGFIGFVGFIGFIGL